jgi:hypothetical protein
MSECCSICCDNIEEGNVYCTPCGHIYHVECIKNWTKDNSKCPMCRRDIGTVQKEFPVSPILDALFVLNFFSNI